MPNDSLRLFIVEVITFLFPVFLLKADVDVSFELLNLEDAEILDPSWTDPQLLCSQKKASVRGKLGPFGLLAFATKDLKEQTAIYFRIFRSNHKYIVLMCSDQSRLVIRLVYKEATIPVFLAIKLA